MLEDITNSIKAKLYDFTYTPFMSSVLISWIVINHKYLLIYFGESKLERKLALLNDYNSSVAVLQVEVPYSMNIILPILFGLFYVFVYPKASKVFYEYTLERTKELKKIKRDIEDVTPVTQEEAREIREDIDRLREARDEALNTLRTVEEKYKVKLDNQLEPLKSSLANAQQEIKKLTDEKQDISRQLSQSNDFLSKKNEEHANLQSEIEKLRTHSNAEAVTNKSETPVKKEKSSRQKENDETKVLRFFYESNYKPKNESNLLDAIVTHIKLARPKAKKIVQKLLKDDFLRIIDNGFKKNIYITDDGNELLLQKFDTGED